MRASLLLFATLAAAQTLSFEAASIKPAEPPEPGRNRSNRVLAGGVDWEFATLRYAVAFTYGVKEYQISAPAWLAEDRWQIHAKAPAGATRDQLPAMMRALLAERFGLRVHREEKQFDGLALVVANGGPKLRPATGSIPVRTSITLGGPGKIEAEHMSMTDLARLLTDTLGRPVADQTELLGAHAFTLEYAAYEARGGTTFRIDGPPPGNLATNIDPGVSVFRSIQNLGLRLQPRKVPLDVIVVDHAEKQPTEN